MRIPVREDLRLGVIASIVASVVFVFVLEPLSRLFGRALLTASGRLADAYRDRLFQEIATGRPDFAHAVQIFLSGLLLCGLAVYSLAVFVRIRSMLRDSTADAPTESAEAALSRLREDLRRLRKDLRRSTIGLFFSFVALCVMLVAINLEGYVRLSIATSFEQHLTILTPHVPDRTIQVLRARYASMRRSADYDSIRHDLAALARQASVSLPPNRLYPVP